MALVGDGRGGVFCANSLAAPNDWTHSLQQKVQLGSFDVVLTNPPFGKKIVVKGEKTLAQYDLGHKWKRNKKTMTLEQAMTVRDDQSPQILFIERCLQLLKPGGRLGMVLPEAIFGMPTYEYVVLWLRKRAKIRGVLAMPEALFKTSGKGGTHVKVCILLVENTKPTPNEDYEIFMADAKWCGHDSRANPTYKKDKNGNLVLLDDIPLIEAKFKEIVGSW